MLLNCDIKIYSKALAFKILKFLPQLIHTDQVGLISGCQASDFTRRILNLIHGINNTNAPSLVAEKAFDWVHWGFLESVLSKFSFHNEILTAIMALYSSSTVD